MESSHKPNGSHFLKSRMRYVALLAVILWQAIWFCFALYDPLSVTAEDDLATPLSYPVLMMPEQADTPAVTAPPSEGLPKQICLGSYQVTAYCPCKKCCGKDRSDPFYGVTASGTRTQEGRTVAVDPTDIPYGTRIYIDGSPYIAEDCGGAIQGKKIDLFFEFHEDAVEYGVQQHEVWIDVPTTIPDD